MSEAINWCEVGMGLEPTSPVPECLCTNCKSRSHLGIADKDSGDLCNGTICPSLCKTVLAHAW